MSETQQNPSFDFSVVIEDAKKVITNPVEFYRSMPTSGGYANPLIFAAVLAVATGLLLAILSIVGLGKGAFGGAAYGISAVILMPIFAVISCFIGGAVLFVIWKLIGTEQPYEAAVRCTAYSLAIMPVVALIAIVPYIGSIVQALWTAFLGYTASVEVGKTKQQTSMIVFAIIALIMVLSNVGSESAARNLSKVTEQYENSDLTKAFSHFENIDEMTPEQAGKAAGEFLKSLEQFGKGLEESINEENQQEQKEN